MLIDIQELVAGYSSRAVLHGVTFSFKSGAVGLLGPNGAGKSTLLKTLLGFIPPLQGSVQVLGMQLPQMALEVRSRVGYMPESESFIPGMNAVQFVAYMAELSGLPRSAAMERSHEVLQYVGLGESRYRNVETYSLGMKQRVKLAQAIVHDPALLLLDEPTNGLDPPGRISMLELVQDLVRNKGMSVILCSHLLKDVETIANEILVLGNGRLVSKEVHFAPTENPLDAPRIYSLRFRGDRTAFIRSLADAGIQEIARPGQPEVWVRLEPGQDTHLLYQCAQTAGGILQRLEMHTGHLEDLFVKAVGELDNAHL